MMLTAACVLCAFMLAGEPVRFDAGRHPQFTAHQIATISDATRAGLAQWAKTPQAAKLLERFHGPEYTIVIEEDLAEQSPGRAPQPGIAMLMSAGDRAKQKTYSIVLNPSFFRPAKDHAPHFTDEPLSAADVMAAAFAAEMLHIDFYSRGISLPHHERPDFQREWRAIADDLGMPSLRHDSDDDRDTPRRGPMVQILGGRD